MTTGGDVSRSGSKILLVDDLALRRASLQCLLGDWARDHGYVLEGVASIRDAMPPDDPQVRLVLVSVAGGPGDTGEVTRLIESFGKVHAGQPVVVLSDADDPAQVVATLKAGARGFLTARSEPAIVFRALEFILGGGFFFPPAALLQAATREPEPALRAPIALDGGRPAGNGHGIAGLTLRQSEVLHLLRLGQSNKHIARELRMCESTVKVHVRQIMRKLGASNRTQAALCAIELGLTEPAPHHPVSA